MFNLTIPQQNIWNLQQFYAGTSISNNCGAIIFEEKCDLQVLEQAINQMLALQDGLRLRFCEENGQPVQYIAQYQEEHFPRESFANQENFVQYAESCAQTPFEQINSPMYRFIVFDLEQKSGVLLCVSHLISDAWAIGLIAGTVAEYYTSLMTGNLIDKTSHSYIHFIESEEKYLSSPKYDRDRSFWTEQYATKPETSPIKPESAPASIPTANRYTTTLSKELTTAINTFYQTDNVSPAVLFETAIVAYLSRINRENHTITLGLPVLNRSGALEKSTIGMCISTTPLTVPVSEEETAEELCKAITAKHYQIFRHQKFPYSHILRLLREQHQFSGNLYDVMVSFQNAKTGAKGQTQWFSNGYSEVPLAFHIDNRDGTDHYTLNIDYQTELFPQKQEVELLTKRILYVLEQILKNPAIQLQTLSIMPENEYKQVVYDFNDTAVEYPRDQCVHELFVEQAARTPDKTALVFENKEFTYRQLDEMSNALAHFLREKGVRPNEIVPIVAKRSWHVIVAMLGVLKAGGAYMPVDPTYPKDRIAYMCQTAKCRLALTCGYKESLAVDTIDLDIFDFTVNTTALTNINAAEHLCYIIFTSGSTGKPKGVSICHRNVINYCDNNINNNVCHNIIDTHHQNIVSVTNIIFDIFVTESLLPLLNGITIYLANEEQVFSQRKLSELICNNAIDVMQTTPTKMRSYLLDKQDVGYLQTLKSIVLGGEALTTDLYLELRRYTNARIFNIYGPAETTVWSTNKKIENTSITIGKPIANTQIYILDTDHKPLPIGIPGELCISGDGVGKGYLNRPELTAEKFIPNPFLPNKTMYCTGDLARWRVDGEIEYLGRMDTQVKIRGLRIELGEIESVMNSFEDIQLTAVTDKRDETGRQYLVGYYTANQQIEEKALRQHLSAKLPQYMVPNYFVQLDEMPLTSSGKTDRRNLPVPKFTAYAKEYLPPQTPTEQKLTEIWEELLKIKPISKTDDFFELGGDSLTAISLLTQLEIVFDTTVTVKDILEHPVLEQLAACIDQAQKHTQKITAAGASRYVPLPQQMAIYAAYRKNPKSLTYNMPAYIKLDETIDRERLKACLLELFQLHPELNTCFQADGDTLYAVFDTNTEIAFEEYSEDDFQQFVQPFDLAHAPLVRIGFSEKAMLFDMHHIIADGESLNIILRDLTVLYRGAEPEKADILYSDYAEYFHATNFDAHKAYFKGMLKCDFEPLTLPEKKSSEHSEGVSRFYQIDQTVFTAGRHYARSNRLTDTMVFLGAFGILLSKYTNQEDILSSVVLTNRTHGETQNVTGMFVNTLPVMLPVSGSTAEYFSYIREMVSNLFEYQELPFLNIAEAVGMQDKNAVNTSFVYQADGKKTLTIGETAFTSEWIDTHTAKFDLTFELTPNENGCGLRIEYNSGKYEDSLIDRLFASYVQILNQLSTETVADISVLSDEEYQKVIYEFNDTAVEYPKDKCVHELFSEQAARTPDKTALIFEDKEFTYRQLDEMSNALAHFLREKGVQADEIVPIVAKRSWHVIVAMLGVLKAGGAYMPVDPTYPDDRIAYMFHTANCRLALTFGFKNKLDIDTVDLDSFDFTANTTPIKNINFAENLCYIIFTSGSTGTPKGVSIRHRNVINYCDNNNNNVCHSIIDTHHQSIVSVTNIIFDIFVTESLLPLLNGLTIYFANEEQVISQRKLSELICNNAIDVLQTTPSKMRSYLLDKQDVGYLQTLKSIILGGEALTTDLYLELRHYTNACIFNIYGPAETTVWSANKKVEDTSITIGKPIANTQIYILDKKRRPLPIGVPGELCISGDGVGKGYLNRPELTAEKFIPNPFLPGKTMYCTGDLARWRADGELEYLGRMDTQVKIRGLRIELGEIESVMNSFDGIQLAVVTDKRDETGRQYLIGYYTAAQKVDEKSLRQHLSAKLPKYMVPNYFVHLTEMPMTPSGKTDRKNLPVPELTDHTQEYVPPQTEQEKILCGVLCELFSLEKAGITDDFFDLGGDSLRAIEYIVKAHNQGIDFPLQSIFDYPTVQRLCQFLATGAEKQAVYTAADFDKYEDLLKRNVVDTTFTPKKQSLGNVLLTGATGFLGAHILDRFMQEESGTIYCLVRGGRDRLAEILQHYFGDTYLKELGHRIVAVSGDITNETLSPSVPQDVQTVIHTAATVKHYGSYEYFHKVNVQGTQNVIRYANQTGAKLIHISTLSVSGNSLTDTFDVYRAEEEMIFAENALYIGQPLENVYIHSKFEAEMAVLDAMLEGLDAKIIRVGNLTNRLSDLKFQPNYESNAFLTRVKAALELGSLPDYLMSLYAEFSPIDQTAEGVIKIAQYADQQTVFHLNSNRPLYFDRLVEILHMLQIRMDIVSGDAFYQTLQELAKNTKTEYLYEAFQNDLDEQGMLVYDSNIHISNDFTVWFLEQVGFAWAEIDFDYIERYIAYFKDIDYFKLV